MRAREQHVGRGSRARRLVISNSPVRRAFAARAAALPIAAVIALLSARIFVDGAGLEQFGIYALAISIPQLVPIGDLGLSAGLIEAAARSAVDQSSALRDAVFEAVRRLRIAGAIIGAAGLALYMAPSLGGHIGLRSGTTAQCVGIALLGFGLSMPFAVGPRVLVGMRQNHLLPWLQLIAPALTLILFALLASAGVDARAFVAAFATAQVCMGVGICITAAKIAGVPLLFPRRHSGSTGAKHLRGFALPAFIISTALPIAYTSDRYILQLVRSLHDVAVYAAIAQVANPCLSLVSTSGAALWGRFAADRAAGATTSRASYLRITRSFTFIGLGLGIALLVVGPYIVGFITGVGIDHQIVVTTLLFSVFVIGQAVQYPTGMLLTDRRGLRFQGKCALVTCVVSLAISYLGAKYLGLPGPILGSVVGFILGLAIPTMVHAYRITNQSAETPDQRQPGVLIYDPNFTNPYGRELANLLHAMRPRYYCPPVADGTPVPAESVIYPVLAGARRDDGLIRNGLRRICGPLRVLYHCWLYKAPIVLTWTRDALDCAIFAAASLLRMPIVLIVHNPPDIRRRPGASGYFEGCLLRVARRLVVHSDRHKETLRGRLRSRTRIVPHLPYLWWVRHNIDARRMSEPTAQRSALMTYVGRPRIDKGLHEMELILSHPALSSLAFQYLGPGDMPEPWSRAAAGNGVHVVSATADRTVLTDSDLATGLASSAVLLAPYTNATQSGSVIMALSAGVGVIAYDSGAIGEIVAANSLVPVGDYALFAQKVRAYIESPWNSTATDLGALEAHVRRLWVVLVTKVAK